MASSQTRIKKKAYKRGFRPQEDPHILECYVEEINTQIEQKLLDSVNTDRASRERSRRGHTGHQTQLGRHSN